MSADFLPRKPRYVRVRIAGFTLTYFTFQKLRKGDFVTVAGRLEGHVGVVRRRCLFARRGYTYRARRRKVRA